jgi:hypothetical protein
MRYTTHAEQKMAERNITQAEVEVVVANPERGKFDPPARDRREHFGYTSDRRPLNVVTNRAATVVITLVLQ